MSRPDIVIAGGSGFLGRRLAAVLAAAGHPITILTRGPDRAPVGPVRFAHWQSSQDTAAGDWTAHLEGASALINLCGESIGGPRWTGARKAALIDSRVAPTRALVHAVNRCADPPAQFLQASGVGYYGTGDEPITEQSAAGSDFLAELAVAWEAPLAELREDVRAIILRTGVVLGNTGGALGQMLLPFRLLVGGPIASGNQWLSWIHLHDYSSAVAHLLDTADSRGVYNVTSPNPIRNHQFAKAAGAALGRPSFMFTPRFVLKALLGEQCTLVCDGQRALPERLLQSGFEFGAPTIQATLRDLT